MINFIENSDLENSIYKVFVGGQNETEFFNEIVSDTQEVVLRQILGNIEYNELESYIIDGELTSDKWINFVNGTSYNYNGVEYVYKGIKPILIKFIYFFWQKAKRSILSENGEIKKGSIYPLSKMVLAYNSAIDLIQDNYNYNASVYNYMIHSGLFTNLLFSEFKKVNTWGV
jgi:hypothetical protein